MFKALLGMTAVTVAVSIAGCSSASQNPAPSASSTLPPAPSDAVVPVAFGLDRDTAGLQGVVREVSDPGSQNFGQWLTVEQLADRFGASPSDSQAVLSRLEGAGFRGSLDPTRGLAVGEMTVQQARDLLGVELVEFPTATGAKAVIGPAKPLSSENGTIRLPEGVREVAGLAASLPGEQPSASAPSSPTPPSLAPGDCVPLPQLDYLIEGQFGLSADFAATGSNVHVAMLEVDAVNGDVLRLLSQCYGIPEPQFEVLEAGPTAASDFSGEVESDLDLTLLYVGAQGLRKVTAVQFDSITPIVFPLAEAVRASYQPDGPTIITTSVGFCEPDVQEADMELSEWVLMSAAATGVTTIASTGDSGSSSCAPRNTSEQPQYPSSSPFVTGVGGTQFGQQADLSAAQSDPARARDPGVQVVWNAGPRTAGAGGSTTSRLDRPWYQDQVHGDDHRQVPDVAYLAAPFALSPVLLCDSSGNCQQSGVGGTSASAPSFAAAVARVAVAGSTPGAAPLRLGLLNPRIYQLAATEPTTVVDVTEGNNDIYSVGCCQAARGYDPASGWGLLDVRTLVAGETTERSR